MVGSHLNALQGANDDHRPKKAEPVVGKFVADRRPTVRACGATVAGCLLAAVLAVGCGSMPSPTAAAASQSTDTASSEPSIAVTPDMGTPHRGDAAPDFELSDQAGHLVKLSSLRGSVVMLAFVTSWCPFSEAEQPRLRELAADYAGKNVKVIAVDIKENDIGYAKYLARAPMPFPVLHDATGEVTARYTPDHAQPAIKDRSSVLVTSNVVIDGEGKIAFFTMVDTVHFDARLVHARRAIDGELARLGPR
jgi:peroxiredoxin